MVVIVVLCFGIELFVLFQPNVRFHIIRKFGKRSVRLLGNSCSFGLRYVFLVHVHVIVPNCTIIFFSNSVLECEFLSH